MHNKNIKTYTEINNIRTSTVEREQPEPLRVGVGGFYWYQVFTLDSVVKNKEDEDSDQTEWVLLLILVFTG